AALLVQPGATLPRRGLRWPGGLESRLRARWEQRRTEAGAQRTAVLVQPGATLPRRGRRPGSLEARLRARREQRRPGASAWRRALLVQPGGALPKRGHPRPASLEENPRAPRDW